MKKILVACLFMITHIAYSYASSVTINQISFDGLHRVSSEIALFNLPLLKIGNTVSNDDVAHSIQTLFYTGYFEEIAVSINNFGVMIITVKERPIINTINFQGNKIINLKIAQQILDIKEIKSGKPLNNCLIAEAKDALQDMCCNFGLFNATVKIISVVLQKKLIDLQVIFCEGKIAKIHKIEIFGNCVFSKERLLKQFKLYNRLKWKHTLFLKQYHKQKMFDDLESLRFFYLNHGYAKFHINDVQVNLTSDKNSVCISIYINEGEQYSIQSLTVLGNIYTVAPEIKEYLQTCSKKNYNNKIIKEIENNIQYTLDKYGYIHPMILTEYVFDDHNKSIYVYIYVDVKHQSYVREVRLEGNNITKDSVIRREINQTEQTPLNYICILKDQERLNRLGYFKTVNAQVKPILNSKNYVNVIYEIEEHNTGSINCSVGFGTESGFNTQVGISQENLLGSGNSISLSMTKNNYQTHMDMFFLKRYLGINKIHTSVKMFYDNFFNKTMYLSKYNIKNYGVDFDCLYPFRDYQTCNVGISYVSNHLSQIIPQILIWRYLNSLGILPETIVNKGYLNNDVSFRLNDFLINLKWIFNNLNYVQFPTFGSYINISGKITLPGSNNQYYKIVFDTNHYLPLDKLSRWILTSNLMFGYAKGLYNKENPFYDNFYVGGINTIRGFRLNSIGPKAVYYCCDHTNDRYSSCAIKESQDAVGGNSIISVKNELVVPVLQFYNTQYSDVIRVSFFIDSGTVWDSYWKNTALTQTAGIVDYSISKYIRISSGISIKWMSPVGPVMFSYAKLIKKYPGDIAEPFQFSIGKLW